MVYARSSLLTHNYGGGPLATGFDYKVLRLYLGKTVRRWRQGIRDIQTHRLMLYSNPGARCLASPEYPDSNVSLLIDDFITKAVPKTHQSRYILQEGWYAMSYPST